jgi:hypothetical protein
VSGLADINQCRVCCQGLAGLTVYSIFAEGLVDINQCPVGGINWFGSEFNPTAGLADFNQCRGH